jgi:hypothetical protein
MRLFQLFLVNDIFRNIKGSFKWFRRGKDFWIQEIQQAPQLYQIVLQGCSSQQKSIFTMEPAHSLANLGEMIFDFVSLIENNVLKMKTRPCRKEGGYFDHFVGSYDDIVLVCVVGEGPALRFKFVGIGRVDSQDL